MKAIKDLKFGYSDAENYKRRENRELFNHLFMRNKYLENITEQSTTFLVGDKGTGKTAYAVYLSNNMYKNTDSSLRYIRETEYQKFIALKKEKHLDLSDYVSIWKVILYLLISEQVYEGEKRRNPLFSSFTKLHTIHDAIQEYYIHAFSPEIMNALQFVQESKIAAELLSKYAKVIGVQAEKCEFTESRYQINLLYIQKNFEAVLKSLKLKNNYVLFIDGVDIRPASVHYDEYLECIKGLANAVWEVNNDFFPSINDSRGRMRSVLLIRPDIYASLGLQNQNTKIRDNAVLLKWGTTYTDYRNSDLFAVSDRLLSHDQPEKLSLETGDAWDYYFPFEAPTIYADLKKPTSFLSFLRFALYRPRDIVTMMTILQERFIEQSSDQDRVFNSRDFDDSVFRRNYADYLLGEVKDQLSFYYTTKEYETFLKFFEYLNGKYKFTYQEFLKAFNNHIDFMKSAGITNPRFMASPEEFLQFLYELNVICFIERTEYGNEPFIHWSFKDRTYSNIRPKVKVGKEYEIFYGMSKALNTGKQLKS